MVKDKLILAIIPARGGSKGVLKKNIRNLAGKPLIAWTIEEAKKSKYIDRLIVSSDNTQIIKVAEEWGAEAPFVRPSEISRDDTPGIDPVLHAMDLFPDYDYVVLLQPTSPFRKVNDIDGCIKFFSYHKAPACVSVTETNQSPYLMFFINKQYSLSPIMKRSGGIRRRQELPKVYVLNGAIYIAQYEYLKKTKDFLTEGVIGYEMPKERSIDIDEESDFIYAEAFLAHRHQAA